MKLAFFVTALVYQAICRDFADNSVLDLGVEVARAGVQPSCILIFPLRKVKPRVNHEIVHISQIFGAFIGFIEVILEKLGDRTLNLGPTLQQGA